MFAFFAHWFGNKGQKTRQANHPCQTGQLKVEELMPRIAPAAHGLHFGGGHFLANSHALFSGLTAGNFARGHEAHADDDAGETGGETGGCHHGEGQASLVASLSNSAGATGNAAFNSSSNQLRVSVHGAAVSTSLDIAIDGTTVGTVTTDASGNGYSKLTLTGTTVQAGSAITIGDLTGSFVQTQLSATLTGVNGETGNAHYSTQRDSLRLFVQGAAANMTYNVTINDTVVGQFTTNSAGRGKFFLSPTNASIAAGSSLSVADTAGNAAILTGTFA